MEKDIRNLRSLGNHNDGNVLIMVALFIVVLFAIGGAGVDFGRAQLVKMKAQQAADAAALAAANPQGDNPTPQDREAAANLYYNLNFPETYLGVKRPAINYHSDNFLKVSVDGTANVDTNFIRTTGRKSVDVSAGSKVDIEIKETRYDIILVLDISDSMDWKFDGTKCALGGGTPCNNNDGNPATTSYPFCYSPAGNYYSCGSSSRLRALRRAARSLTDIMLADDVKKNNRIAVVTWNDQFRQRINFTNNRNTVINFLNNMSAFSSTNSTAGLQEALNIAGNFKAGTVRAVVLLTDGENNGGGVTHDQSIDNSSIAICNQLTGMNPTTIIYTIALGSAVQQDNFGNFLKPEGTFIDQFLRKCASGAPATNKNQYYFIAPSAQQLETIFTTIATTLQKLRITD